MRQSRVDDAGLESAPHTPRASVLLVDDQPARLLSYEAILGGLDVNCVRALSGTAALAALLKDHFAVILLDVQMPEMDGFEVARLLRAHPRYEQTPIIFVTGVHVSELDQLKGYQAGAIDYVAIPIVPEILRAKVAVLVELYHRRREFATLTPAVTAGESRIVANALHGSKVDSPLLDSGRQPEPENADTLVQVADELKRARIDLANANRELSINLEVMTRLQQLGAPFNEPHALNSLLDEIIQTAIELTHANRGTMQLLEDGALRIVAYRGFDEAFLDYFNNVKAGECACGTALEQGKRIIVENVATSPIFLGTAALEVMIAAGVQAVQSTPMFNRCGKLMGMLSTHYSTPQMPSEHDLRVLDILARRGADLIARNAAERARDQAKDALDLALKAGRAGWFDWDPQKDINHWSDQLLELYGIKREEFGDSTFDWRAALFPEDRERAIAALERSLQTGQFDVSFRVIRRDSGQVRWMHGAGRVFFEDGKPARMVGINVDITAQKEAEEQKRKDQDTIDQQLAEIEVLYRTAPVGLTAFDRQMRCIRINEHMAAMNGVPISASVGRHLRDYMPRAFSDAMEPLLRRVLESGKPLKEAEARGETAAGAYRQWLVSLHPLWNAQQDVVGVSVAVQDVTEQREAAAALAALSDELRLTFNATTIGLIRCSRDLRYLMANSAYAEIAGLPLERIVGRPIVEVIGAAGLETIRPYVERVLRGERVEYQALVPYDASGPRLMQVTYTPWKDPDGSVSGWIASVTDVTARRRAEEKLEMTSRQKDQFLAMLAHELRNPLAPIRNASELLTHAVGSHPEAQAPLSILHRQTLQLSRLVDDLLDVSRIAQGRILLQEDILAIEAVIDQAVETVRPLVKEKSHRLSIHKPSAPLYTRGDLARLVQSVGNVLHNAAKYTDPRGEIEINIAESNGELLITVRDSGCGISADMLPNVFDLFVQGPRTLDRSQGGLGIGLTIVKQLVEMHRGSIAAESEGSGRGSTFTIRLPCVEPPRAQGSEGKRAAPARRRILVVDDNIDGANSLAMLLRIKGHEVTTAFGGLETLASVERLKPEVVILDIGLPGMNGYELAQRLRASHGTACPRLIALTGYGQPADRARALECGFLTHLTKPVDLQVLQGVLADNLDGSGGDRR